MKPVLRQVYEYLRNNDKVKNQLAFAKSLKPDSAPDGLNDSYVSRLMRSAEPLPKKIVWAVHETWGVSYEWLASSGKLGSMFGAPTVKPAEVVESDDEEGENTTKKVFSGDEDFNILRDTKSIPEMMDRMLKIMEDANANTRILAEANRSLAVSAEKQGEASLINAATISQLISPEARGFTRAAS